MVDNHGVPQSWAKGQINYYTDQGDLSPLLRSAQADQFVADAWSRWTSIPLASLTVDHAGQLNEDVTGANFVLADDVARNSAKPVTIVYDADGSVVDELLGRGAGVAAMCSTNSVLGQIDRIGNEGHFAHALVVINGNCAQDASDLPVLKYRLVRVLGRILGLDYSQVNENVVTGTPAPTADDYAGYPVMHPLGAICTEISCLTNADVPRMDDRAALARLYPVATFTENTARVHGVVRFPDWRGSAGQGMQGVNVVARLVDPSSGRVSRQYAASSVSGFLFRGNAGNPMTGFVMASGERWDGRGSSDPEKEGYYDLSGLEIPDGYNAATYELSVEPVNPLYVGSISVGPYAAGQVASPGAASSVRVTIARGAEVAQNFVMKGATAEQFDVWEPSSFVAPRPIPFAGSWTASLSGYGDRDYYLFQAEANRTFTWDVTAIDANALPTVDKALPVLGVWTDGDAENTPEVAETFFNTQATAATRLQVVVGAAGNQKVGVADYRGDGRPDFRYFAHLFYADKLTPARVPVQGGSVVTIAGYGFTKNTQVSVGGAPVTATMVAADRIVFRTPSLSDGAYTVLLTDPSSGATSQMTSALAVGSAGAKLLLVNGANPQVPVGSVAPNSVQVQVVDTATGDPVGGATVLFAVPSSAAVVGCDASPCSIITDQSGMAGVRVQVKQAGASVITASLSTGGSVSATVNGLAATLEITLAQPNVDVGAGAEVGILVSALVVGNGAPVAGSTVNFLKNYGTGVIAPASSTTGSNGIAGSMVSVTGIMSDVNISACVAPANAPCRTLLIHPVADADLRLQKIGGDAQVVTVGQNFAPLVLRVTDASGNPVIGVPVHFDIHAMQAVGDPIQITNGEVVTTHYSDPATLLSSSVTLVSDGSGSVTLPGIADQKQPVAVKVRVTAGQAESELELKSIAASLSSGAVPTKVNSALRRSPAITRRKSPVVRQR